MCPVLSCVGCLHPGEGRRHGEHTLYHRGAGHHLQATGRDGPAARGAGGKVSLCIGLWIITCG